jgi:hypothetical protein
MDALRINEAVNSKPSVEDPTVTGNIHVTYKSLPRSIEEKEAQYNRKLDQIHHQASRATKKEMARTLKELLSARLTAYIIGQSERTINRWANEESGIMERMLSINTMRRLITLYEIVLLITYFEDQETAKRWLLGMNPQLNDLMPAEAIRNGQLREAIVAARSFVSGN